MRPGAPFAALVLALALVSPGAGLASEAAPDSAPAALGDVEIAAIQQLCETASIEYAAALDGKDPERLARAFAPDGVWEVLGNRMEGREAIAGYWRGRLADWTPDHGRIHQIANQTIEVIDRDHARGTSTVFVYFFSTTEGANAELVPTLISRNHDEFVRTGEGWKLKHRRIERIANVGAH